MSIARTPPSQPACSAGSRGRRQSLTFAPSTRLWKPRPMATRSTVRWTRGAGATVVVVGLPVLLASPASAHRSGCHAAHSCPSDLGTYVCGDAGHPCGGPDGVNPRSASGRSAATPSNASTSNASTSRASTSRASTSRASTSRASTSRASTAAPRQFAHTGVKLVAGEVGVGALWVGVLLVVFARRLVENSYDPSILPHLRQR